MVKGPTTVYIEEELKEQLKALGINLSGMVSKIAEVLVEDAMAITEEMALQVLREEEARIEVRLKEIDLEKSRLVERQERMAEQIATAKRRIAEFQASTQIASLFRELNSIIEASEYDKAAAWEASKQVRKQIEEINKRDITPEIFARMVERLADSWR